MGNDSCMDVKLLVFDGSDVVRWIPHGGVFGGHLLPRGGLHRLGHRPPHAVKFYAPWGKEIGAFLVEGGMHSFRATMPPLLLVPSSPSSFINHTESLVRICICDQGSWSSTPFLPMAAGFARISWPMLSAPPGERVPITTPCVLRVFQGLS